MANRVNKPKKAFYTLTNSGDFEQRRPATRYEDSDDEPPPLRDDPLTWGQGGSQTTPEALRKYPVVDDGIVRVRRIKSKALHREPSNRSTTSNNSVQSQDSVEEIAINEGRSRVKRRSKDKDRPKVRERDKEVELQPTEFRKNSARCWGAFRYADKL